MEEERRYGASEVIMCDQSVFFLNFVENQFETLYLHC